MEQKKERIVSYKHAKRDFNSIGLMLIIYIITVLFFPIACIEYFKQVKSVILNDEMLYYGIYFIIILFGTLIPFSLMRLMGKIKLRKIFRPIKVSFADLFVQTIVVFAACTALTYASNMLLNRFGYEGELISSIGLNFNNGNIEHHLYIFMLIIVTPLLEEYAFRGVLLGTLGRYGKSFGLLASSIIYALAHCTVGEVLPALMMGYLLGKISLRYKSIQPTIIIHVLFNSFLYGLCVIPSFIARYMAYGLAAICFIAMYLILSKKYRTITIQKLRSYGLANKLFYSRPTIIFAMALMVGHIVAYQIFK